MKKDEKYSEENIKNAIERERERQDLHPWKAKVFAFAVNRGRVGEKETKMEVAEKVCFINLAAN